MSKNVYEKFYKGELPEALQKAAESFACVGDSVGEVIFRAGYYIGLHHHEYREEINPLTQYDKWPE